MHAVEAATKKSQFSLFFPPPGLKSKGRVCCVCIHAKTKKSNCTCNVEPYEQELID